MIVYYAHSRLIYGSALEARNIETIKRILAHETTLEIINPATFDQNRPTDEIMNACFSAIHTANMVVISTIDGNIGLGAYREIELAEDLKIDVYLLYDNRLYWMDSDDVALNPYDKYCYASIRLARPIVQP